MSRETLFKVILVILYLSLKSNRDLEGGEIQLLVLHLDDESWVHKTKPLW